jgi:hypothetical protein
MPAAKAVSRKRDLAASCSSWPNDLLDPRVRRLALGQALPIAQEGIGAIGDGELLPLRLRRWPRPQHETHRTPLGSWLLIPQSEVLALFVIFSEAPQAYGRSDLRPTASGPAGAILSR